MFRHILVTLDGSPYGERVLSYIADLAEPTSARVTLFTVVPEEAAPGEAASASEARIAVYQRYLDERAEEVRSTGVQDVTALVRAGVPSRTIVTVARELEADLIAMSTQGLGAESDQGLGGVASKVLMSAPCPLFMVRTHRPEPPRNAAEERWQSEGGANVG